jgi:hypothetical protein
MALLPAERAQVEAVLLRAQPELLPRVDALFNEYERFIALKLATDPQPVTPCKAVDAVWHAHLLCTRAYAALCGRANGGAMIVRRPATAARHALPLPASRPPRPLPPPPPRSTTSQASAARRATRRRWRRTKGCLASRRQGRCGGAQRWARRARREQDTFCVFRGNPPQRAALFTAARAPLRCAARGRPRRAAPRGTRAARCSRWAARGCWQPASRPLPASRPPPPGSRVAQPRARAR